MVSRTLPGSCVPVVYQRVVPVLSSTRGKFAYAVGVYRSEVKFTMLGSISSNCRYVEFGQRLQAVQKTNGRLSVCSALNAGIMPGQPSERDSSKAISSAKETNHLHEANSKDDPTVRLQMRDASEVHGVENKEVSVEEYKPGETGQLRKEEVIAPVISGSPISVRNLMIRVTFYFQLLMRPLQGLPIQKFIKDFRNKKPVKANPSESKEAVDSFIQWTTTDLNLQRAQMVRIAQDTRYLVWAFGLFGIVRILEAVVATFTSKPVHLGKLLDASNAFDPLSVAWLAHGMRQPMVAILKVDHSNLEEVSRLKIRFWKELHAYYERQWKLMATLGVARLLNLIATHHPAAQFVTHKLQFLWSVILKLPVF